MTINKAISIIKVAIAEVEWNYPLDYAIAFETAIEVLNKLNSDDSLKHARSLIKSVVLEQPTADVQIVVHGEWKVKNDTQIHHCSVCGAGFNLYPYIMKDYNYCPSCGAKMEVQNV